MMVYAAAPHAEGYTFTSALPTQALKTLMPALQPLLQKGLCQSPERPGPGTQPVPTDIGRSAPLRQPVQGRIGLGLHEAVMRADLEAPYRFLVSPPQVRQPARTVEPDAAGLPSRAVVQPSDRSNSRS
jgi:hypothetical protein